MLCCGFLLGGIVYGSIFAGTQTLLAKLWIGVLSIQQQLFYARTDHDRACPLCKAPGVSKVLYLMTMGEAETTCDYV